MLAGVRFQIRASYMEERDEMIDSLYSQLQAFRITSSENRQLRP